MNAKYNDFTYIFHSTNENFSLVKSHTSKSEIKNYEIISDEKIKSHILRKSIFAVSKSGTVSLEICNAKIPSIIIYKMNFINFLIIKMLVTTKFANIINIAAKKEIIPELIQNKCNPKNIYNTVNEFLNNPVKIKNQILEIDNILSSFKTEKPSAELASTFINKIIKQC